MIRCEHITVKKGTARILDDVTLSLRPGKLLVILGPNGAGKSTLLKVLTGAEQPDVGTVHMDEKPLQDYSLKELAHQRAVFSQHSAMNFPFTAFEIALMGRHPFVETTETQEDIAIAVQAMREADASHLAERLYPTLSGGEQQRVQLARVLAQIQCGKQGRFLFLDEPTSSLDLKHQYMTLQVARTMAQLGLGVFCILHDINLAAHFADEIALMKQGRIIYQGATAEVLNEKNLSDVYDVEITSTASGAVFSLAG